jgi:uncharacterized protein (TIGR02588 family)
MGQDRQPDDRTDPPHGTVLEWSVAALSALIVAAMIGFLAVQAMGAQGAKPDPVAQVTEIVRITDGFRVEIAAINRGRATAANVTFRAELRRDGTTAETAEVTFDFLPARSQREGAVIFALDPGHFEVVLQAESYTKP